MILVPELILCGDAGHVLQGMAVRINGNRIVEVEPLEILVSRYGDELTTVFSGCSLLPGLIEAHTHLGGDGASTFVYDTPEALLKVAETRLEMALKSGVTTVRDVGSPDGIARKLQEWRQAGKKLPRIFSSCAALVSTGGHSDQTIFSKRADGPEAIRLRIRELKQLGADYIKVMDSEAYRGMEYSQEELDAAAEEAHLQGLQITAHAGSQPSVDMCVRAGFDAIEHGNFMTEENAEAMIERKGTLIPTMLAFQTLADFLKEGGNYLSLKQDGYSEEALAMTRKNLKVWKDRGLRVACGTDMILPYKTPHPVADEVAMLLTAGFTPAEAIEAATVKGAELLCQDHELGRIAPGYLADLFLVKGNPLKDISALKAIQAVFADGERII